MTFNDLKMNINLIAKLAFAILLCAFISGCDFENVNHANLQAKLEQERIALQKQLAAQEHQLDMQEKDHIHIEKLEAGKGEREMEKARLVSKIQEQKNILQAEIDRLDNAMKAETERLNDQLIALSLKVVGIAAVLGLVTGLIAFFVRQYRSQVAWDAEVTRRHKASLEADLNGKKEVLLFLSAPNCPLSEADKTKLVDKLIYISETPTPTMIS